MGVYFDTFFIPPPIWVMCVTYQTNGFSALNKIMTSVFSKTASGDNLKYTIL